MASEQIHITRQKVISTDAYQSLSKIQKMMVVKRNNIKIIEHALNVIGNIGFPKWEKQSNSSYLNILIIKEIHKK